MQVAIAPALEQGIRQQLQALYAAQTAPFQGLVADYCACLQSCRELEVRAAQLDKEAAELRDENDSLHKRLRGVDEASAQDSAAKLEALRAELQEARAELSGLYKDKSKALEEALAAQRELVAVRSKAAEQAEELARQADEISGLKKRLSEVSSALDTERTACSLAASEAEARIAAKEAAEARAEALASENAALVQRLMDLKSTEAARLEEINRLHEEAFENAKRWQMEAAADKQLAGMLAQRRGSRDGASSSQAATSAPGSASISRRGSGNGSGGGGVGFGAAAAAVAAFSSLKQAMGLPEAPAGVVPERSLPNAPAKFFQAHKGGATSLSFERPGHFVATCGMDRCVQTWDLNLLVTAHSYQGMMGTVNDVSWTCDGRRIVGAGADKRLLMWDTHSGQTRHTLTGHTAAVSCVSCSPLDVGVAVSAGEDRLLKVWDLARGYSSRTVPCVKMPNALAVSLDGSTILTGHLDGTMSLWDMRQSRAGAQALAEVRDHTQTILSIATTSVDGVVLTVAKDSALRLWDFRALSVSRVLRAPAFTVGSIGSVGRAKCHAEVTADGRWAAAGALDGTVFVWDLKAAQGSPAVVKQLKHHKDAVVATGWSSDCSSLVSCDKAGVVAFWQCT